MVRSILSTNINAVADKLLEHVKNEEAEGFEDDGIPGQVLGVFLMAYGAHMSDDARKFILLSAGSDEWATTDKERRGFITRFIRQVREYKNNGRPRHVAHESLMHWMIIFTGGGLVNKTPKKTRR